MKKSSHLKPHYNVGIIVLNFNSFRMTMKCIDNIINTSMSESIIVIVDNCSSDESFDQLKNKYCLHTDIRVIRTNSNKGYAAGNNYGVKYLDENAECENICIINPDVIVENTTITQLCSKLHLDPEIAAISGIMVLNGKVNLSLISWDIPKNRELICDHFIMKKNSSRRTIKKSYNHNKYGLLETETVPGSFFIIKNEVFHKVGLFDEGTFLYCEENILGIKLKEKRYKCALYTNCFFFHNHNSYSSEEIKNRYLNRFQDIIRDNQFNYESRKYMCKEYYNGRGIAVLYLINVINILMLRTKRVLYSLHIIK